MKMPLLILIFVVVVMAGVWLYYAGRECTFRIPTEGPETRVCWWSWGKLWR
jgi:hypothetical protein